MPSGGHVAGAEASPTRALILATISFALSFAAWGLVGGLASVFAALYNLTASQTALLVFVLIVVILQLWLLTATMNAWLGGDDSVVWPAAAVSGGGLALNVGLLTFLGRIERTRRIRE